MYACVHLVCVALILLYGIMSNIMREVELATGEIFHVCNRTVEWIKIFNTPEYAEYFLESLLLANTFSELPRDWRRKKERDVLKAKNDLVDFYALELMPDHFHILLKQIVENGVQKLMQRTCNGLAKLFNAREGRRGHLFIGPYKAVRVSSDAQGQHLLTYLHANSLDLISKSWREGKFKDWPKAEKILKSYRWSSLPVFLNESAANPIICKLINKEFFNNYYNSSKEHIKALREWSSEDYEIIENVTNEQ